MEPIIDNDNRLPAAFEARQPEPFTPAPMPTQGANTVIHYHVFVDPPRAVEPTAPTEPGRAWKYVQLGFVAATMTGGAVLYALGHPAEGVVSVLVGLGLGAVKIVKKLVG